MLGELSWQQQAHGSLDLPTSDGVLLVVVGQTRGLGSNALEDVVHERVHDAHGLAGDTSLGVDLLQDFVDVDRVALLALPVTLLVLSGRLGFGGGLLLALLASDFARHDACRDELLNVDWNKLNRDGWHLPRDHFYIVPGGSLEADHPPLGSNTLQPIRLQLKLLIRIRPSKAQI